jgi:hypothetical protein
VMNNSKHVVLTIMILVILKLLIPLFCMAVIVKFAMSSTLVISSLYLKRDVSTNHRNRKYASKQFDFIFLKHVFVHIW